MTAISHPPEPRPSRHSSVEAKGAQVGVAERDFRHHLWIDDGRHLAMAELDAQARIWLIEALGGQA